LLKASHKEHETIVGLRKVKLLPGQFIFTFRTAAKETGLSLREIRTIVDFLRKAGNTTHETTHTYSVVTIENWLIYQSDIGTSDTPNDKRPTHDRHIYNNGKNGEKKTPPEISSEISAMKDRYPDQETINQAFTAISSTRKSNRIADSVELSILKAWERYPVESVMAGIKTFLEKGYQNQGKDEKYLLGIIRNSKPEASTTGGHVMKSTGSPLLDDHYRGQGIRII